MDGSVERVAGSSGASADRGDSGGRERMETRVTPDDRQRFLAARDRGEFSQPAARALALVQQLFLRSFADEFGLTARDLSTFPKAEAVLPPDPEDCARRIFRQSARVLAIAKARGHPDVGTALAKAAERAVTETFSTLIDVGTFDEVAGVVVQEMLNCWGEQLARLVQTLEDDDADDR